MSFLSLCNVNSKLSTLFPFCLEIRTLYRILMCESPGQVTGKEVI